MPNLVAAVVGGSLLSAGSSIYGANRAAGATSDASQRATAAELQMYNQSRADLAPYRQAGYGALDLLTQLYGISAPAPTATGTTAGGGTISGDVYLGPGLGKFAGSVKRLVDEFGNRRQVSAAEAAAAKPAPKAGDLSQFFTSPQYQFVRTEGLRGIANSRAAQGSGSGGNAIRGAEGFASGLASQEFGSYVDRLFSIAGLGSGATQVGVQAASNAGSNLASIYQNAGNARASAYMAGASGVNNALQGGLQNWSFMNYLNSGSGFGGTPPYIPSGGTGGSGGWYGGG